MIHESGILRSKGRFKRMADIIVDNTCTVKHIMVTGNMY